MRTGLVLALLVSATVLAGCASSSGGNESSTIGAGAEELKGVTDDTGGIRGVVVDGVIAPIVGATVVLGGDKPATATTDANGFFNFTGLKPGEYLLKATKIGYEGSQTTATVEAGVKDPKVVKMQLLRIAGIQPFIQPYKLEGYYECAFTAVVITDQCDFGVRTAYDFWNGNETCDPLLTGACFGDNPLPGPPPFPRNLLQGQNTQYFDVPAKVQAIVQEAYWDDPAVTAMMITLSETPIDNACDCSPDYMAVDSGASPTYARMDKEADPEGFPTDVLVAARGFLPFFEVQTAQNFRFTVFTNLFFDFVPHPDWTFATKDDYPVPK